MHNDIDHDRRRLVGAAAITLVASQFAFGNAAEAQASKARPANLGAVKPGTHTSFASLKQIDAGVLNIGYAEAGPANGPAVILLHGWPYDIYSFVGVAPCSRPKATVSSFHICAAMARPVSSRMERLETASPRPSPLTSLH